MNRGLVKPALVIDENTGRKALPRFTHCKMCGTPLTSLRASKGQTNVCSAPCGLLDYAIEAGRSPRSEIACVINWEGKYKSKVRYPTSCKIKPFYCIDCGVFIRITRTRYPLKRCIECAQIQSKNTIRVREAEVKAKAKTDPALASKLRAHDTRRRYVRRTAEKTGDLIDLFQLAERDQWICWLCLKKVSKNARHEQRKPHLQGPSMDHVVPISKGGSHTWGNVKLAHFICNSLRGNKMIEAVQAS